MYLPGDTSLIFSLKIFVVLEVSKHLYTMYTVSWLYFCYGQECTNTLPHTSTHTDTRFCSGAGRTQYSLSSTPSKENSAVCINDHMFEHRNRTFGKQL